MTNNEPTETAASDEESGLNAVFFYLSAFLLLIGVALSSYLIWHHYQVKFEGMSDAFCNINSYINCDDVARSRYAELFGIPLGVYGCGYFLGMIIMLFVGQQMPKYAKEALITYKVTALIGVVVSIVFGIISIFMVHALCLNCIGIYLITFAIAGLNYFWYGQLPEGFDLKEINNGSIYPIVGLAVVVIAFQLMKPTSRDFHRDLPQSKEVKAMEQMAGKVVLAPPGPAIPIFTSPFSSFGEDYRVGSDDAKVKLVEFSDFQCPACQAASRVVKQLKGEFGDKILIVFKNYPLDDSCNPQLKHKMHEYACMSAILARCAGRYGKFWQFHDQLYENQEQISPENLKSWSKSLGLTDAQIDECVSSKDLQAKIKDDIELGTKLGLDATPTFFINGRKVLSQRSEDALASEVRSLLAE